MQSAVDVLCCAVHVLEVPVPEKMLPGRGSFFFGLPNFLTSRSLSPCLGLKFPCLTRTKDDSEV